VKKLLLAASATTFLLGMPAKAANPYDWDLIGVHVTVVEATYIPDHVTFQIDTNVPSTPACPAGSWLVWQGQGPDALSKQANVEAVYSLLLAAKLTHNTVNVFGNNGGTFCATVVFIHIQ
jgi:hypothetical protein